MRYLSTRGDAPALAFDDVVLAGLARDGGLYMPEYWPALSQDELRDLRRLSYPELTARIGGLGVAPVGEVEVERRAIVWVRNFARAPFMIERLRR